MPRIDLISVPQYTALDPYHFYFDNLPLQNLMRRQSLINFALDNVIEQTTDAIGTQGTINNRLNQSINPDGSLKVEAIDETLHSIEEHTDTANFVRMTAAQSDKVDLIADEATNFGLEIDDSSDIIQFNQGFLRFVPSSTINWEIVDSTKVTGHLTFPVASAHTHFYDQIPVHQDTLNPDFINYTVNVSATAYVSGSLKVYINGMRLSSTIEIYIAGALINDTCTKISYTEDAVNGSFSLSTAINEEDAIRIDYDQSYI